MIVEGRKPDKPPVDWNQHFETTLKGELKEDEAKKTLGKFLTYNLGMLVYYLTRLTLDPDQRLVLKGWLTRNYTLTVAGRGWSKSWMLSHFCYLYCLLNPNKTIVMIAPTFRSSRRIIEHIERWALRGRGKKNDQGGMLRACIQTQIGGGLVSKKPDVWCLEFKNGSKIYCVPLGTDAENLRGYRASVLAIDEGLNIPQQIIDTVLKPFLIATPEDEVTRRQRIKVIEDRLIANGKMKESERTKYKPNAKMIIISSASYTYQDLFTLYKKYKHIIYSEDDAMLNKLDEEERKKLAQTKDLKPEIEEGADLPSSYLIHQLSYKVAPSARVDASVRKEIESGMYSQSTIKMEYEAQFVQDSDGYYSAKTMEECTLSGESAPVCEIVGEPGAEYVLAIDPNMGASEAADHFAMCLIKIVEQKRDGKATRKVGLVVHQYANAGAKLEHHLAYLFYLLKRFNVVYIAVDTSQGDNMDFINVANESELFRTSKMELKPLDVDFGRETFDHLVDDIRRSYSKAEGRIVQKQYFHSAFQNAANDHLQASFNRHTILFPAKIAANQGALMAAHEKDVGNIINTHPDFVDAETGVSNKLDFIERQDLLIDLVKKECAMIEVKVSSLGNRTFDLPQHVKRQGRTASRNRRDNFSALFLGNWALKLYLEAQEKPLDNTDIFLPTWSQSR